MMNEEMKKAMAGKAMPELAIVDNNTLGSLGSQGTAGECRSDGKDQHLRYIRRI